MHLRGDADWLLQSWSMHRIEVFQPTPPHPSIPGDRDGGSAPSQTQRISGSELHKWELSLQLL